MKQEHPEPTLKSTLKACKDFNFCSDLTAEMCWNEGYRLGRKRWHWGPWWMVNVRGWINTQIQNLTKPILFNPRRHDQR